MTPTPPPVYGIIIFSNSQRIYLSEDEIYALFYNHSSLPEWWYEFFLSLPKEHGTENRIIYFHGFDEEITMYDINSDCEFQITPRDMFLYEYDNDNVELSYLLRFAKFNFGSIINCSINRYLHIVNIIEPIIDAYNQAPGTLGDALNSIFNLTQYYQMDETDDSYDENINNILRDPLAQGLYFGQGVDQMD
jgi:hypothetical protein